MVQWTVGVGRPGPPSDSPPLLFTDFFGPDRPKRDYRVDAAELLDDKPDMAAAKIQTIDAQLFQFSADGKKQPIPGSEILFITIINKSNVAMHLPLCVLFLLRFLF